MNILILGSGGREHALTWKINQSPICKKLFVAPGNSGTAQLATNISIKTTDFKAIRALAIKEEVNMIIVGPEEPLVQGIHDYVLKDKDLKHIAVIGPQKAAAQLEGSKTFAKQFMQRHQIPTAAHKSFTKDQIQQANLFLENLKPPYVLKADGLAAGKGVVILNSITKAKAELKAMLIDSKFGQASQQVVIEEFLDGIELSCFVLTDGKHYKILPTAKDYKRIGENDTGLNTGGMGAVSPVPFVSKVFMDKIEQDIVMPTIKGLQKDNLPYKGFIFIGLIKVGDDPKVIEYNVRLGDPETEVILPRLKNDLLDLFTKVANRNLDKATITIDHKTATTVVIVSGGYPEAYTKGEEIRGLKEVKNAIVFHAGAKKQGNKTITSGGRVLAITAMANTLNEALSTSYSSIKNIHFNKMYYRKDIGLDL